MPRWDDEILSDNSKIEYCRQCKDCVFWGGTDNWTNAYDKSNCLIYQFPVDKPQYVIDNKGDCLYKQKRE